MSKFKIIFYIFLFQFILFKSNSSNADWRDLFNSKNDKVIIGMVENVDLDDAGLILKARIDTGAGLSSINAEIIEIRPKSKNSNEKAVYYIIDQEGKKVKQTRTIVEWVNIKKKGQAGYIKRPVVKTDFCLGGKRIEARVNLADRKGFLYALLIGRNVLRAGDFLIDPKEKFLHKPSCD